MINKHEQAYRAIREAILDGTYGPGYRLVIDALARELGISQMPVREAIRRLEAEGWLRFRPNVGAEVMPVDAAQWEETMRVLAVLDGYATAETLPLLAEDDLAKAREIGSEMSQALDDLDLVRFTRLNREFHFALYGRCPNDYLTRLLRQAWDRLDAMRRTVFVYIPFRARASLAEHDELVALIETGAPAGEVERFAREHKLRTVEAYLEHERPRLAAAARGGL